jgi:glycosyltransferase involved in cell wall biosynthesis
MSMAVAPFIPRTVALQVGTEQIAARERAAGRLRVDVMEPPVDLSYNRMPTSPEMAEFRQRWRISKTAFTIVCVSRLALELKLEGLISAIQAVGKLAERMAVRLLICGDGPARSQVIASAESVNRRLQRDVVTLTGELLDPRPAYACADIAIGMGGSALRALAFGVPLIVQGERGYFRLLTPETVSEFLWAGWYGQGSGEEQGTAELLNLLPPLLADRRRREDLGRFGRTIVADRFSLQAAALRQEAFYHALLVSSVDAGEQTRDLAESALRFSQYQIRRRLQRWTGNRATDDFNARPVIAASGVVASQRQVARLDG